MELTDFLQALIKHNSGNGGYQIHLNSSNLDGKSRKQTGIEFGDLYFTGCSTLENQTVLCFGNLGRKPVRQTEDGTDIYQKEINSNLFIDMSKIETIEDVEDYQDWFEHPSDKVVNVYMYPENKNMSGNRNIITIGFMA